MHGSLELCMLPSESTGESYLAGIEGHWGWGESARWVLAHQHICTHGTRHLVLDKWYATALPFTLWCWKYRINRILIYLASYAYFIYAKSGTGAQKKSLADWLCPLFHSWFCALSKHEKGECFPPLSLPLLVFGETVHFIGFPKVI